MELAGIGHIKYEDLQGILSSYDLDEVALSNLRAVADGEGRIACIGFLELLSKACLPRAFVAELFGDVAPKHFRVGGVGHYRARPVSEAREQSLEPEASPAQNIEDKDEDECPICFSTYWQRVRAPCSHEFCHECISVWLRARKTCPVCRSDLSSWTLAQSAAVSSSSNSSPQIHRWDHVNMSVLNWEPTDAEADAIVAAEQHQLGPEQERIRSLLPSAGAFEIRVGHRRCRGHGPHEAFVETLDGPSTSEPGLASSHSV